MSLLVFMVSHSPHHVTFYKQHAGMTAVNFALRSSFSGCTDDTQMVEIEIVYLASISTRGTLEYYLGISSKDG